MKNAITRVAFCLGLLAMCTALAGCAVEAIPYPELSSVKKLTTRLLSRSEQDEAIRVLTAEQKQHQNTAIREIEKSQ